MGETRVNLKHLLEDLRDSYPHPIEETIITELIANALDSGASEIRFFTSNKKQTLTVVDNGKGMSQQNFEEYHDIASTTKVRGKGIGFAGVGIKLALLIAEKVVTETKKGSLHEATQWKIESSHRAPWEYIKPHGLVNSSNGTAVSVTLLKKDSELLNESFIEKVIKENFYAILDSEFMDNILKGEAYKKGVTFFVNDKKIALTNDINAILSKFFLVKLGRKGKLVGFGLLNKYKEELSEDERGIAISTYGKIIKRGWDWIGLVPRNPKCLSGIIEIPNLSEILTTNKADFLKDTKSLQKYYRYRKAIQEEMNPILQEFGEVSTPREKTEKDLKPLESEIEKVLGNMLNDFPELNPLLGRRKPGEPVKGIIPDLAASPIGTDVEGVDIMTGTKGGSGKGSGIEGIKGEIPGERIELSSKPNKLGLEHKGRRRRPGLMMSFEDDPNSNILGRLLEDTICINKGHPAFRKVINTEAEKYHIVLSVSWVLSSYLQEEKSPQSFMNLFLSSWGMVK